MFTTKKLSSIPAQANPFNHDSFRMGTSIGQNVIVMFEAYEKDDANYLIIINTNTGERLCVEMTSEVEEQKNKENK